MDRRKKGRKERNKDYYVTMSSKEKAVQEIKRNPFTYLEPCF
jgi:hypothetical protein